MPLQPYSCERLLVMVIIRQNGFKSDEKGSWKQPGLIEQTVTIEKKKSVIKAVDPSTPGNRRFCLTMGVLVF